jgi:uncharacterized protein YggE
MREMKRLLSLLLCLLAAPVFAQNAPFVAVHGEADLQVVPDVFPISFDIHAQGMDIARAQSRVEEITRAVLQQARSLGLDDRSIEVGSISIQPRNRYDEKSKQSVFIGNEYQRTIFLRFHDLESLRKQVAAIPAGENVEVETASFELSNAPEVRRKLLTDAIANAKAAAEIMAAGIGRKVLKAQSISTSPMALQSGSYINAIDVTNPSSTTILTAEQIQKVPVPRNVTSVALLAPGTVRTDIALEKGAVSLSAEVYVIYLLGD